MGKTKVLLHALWLCGAILISLFLIACSGGTGGSPPITTPVLSRSPDGASLVRTYVAMLSTDLAHLQPIDAACSDTADACRTALDQAAVIAAKVADDLQHTPAEPDAIQKPVEAIRASVRFVLSIDHAFDSGGMPVPEALSAYMAEFNTLTQALQQLQAGQ